MSWRRQRADKGGAGDKEKEGKEGKASARERGVQEGNIIAVHR